jgi:hypothetical protein
MRRIVQAVTVVAGLAVVAGPAVAQVGEPVRERPAFEARGMRAGAPMATARNPAAAVLAQREALGLSADQVRRLEAVQARVEAANAPRLERLRAVQGERQAMDRDRIRQMSADERQQLRQQMRERMDQVRPVMEELRKTNHAAGDEVRAILTDEQHTQFRDLRRSERRDGAMRGQRGGQNRGEWLQRRGERSERGDVPGRRGPRGGGF